MIHNDYINKRVIVKGTKKSHYRRDNIIDMSGVVTRESSGNVGVLLDGIRNSRSQYGIYWLHKYEVRIIENESEDMNMTGFNRVAIVNLLEDYNKKDYAFALYDEEENLIIKSWNGDEFSCLVVTNAGGKDKRILGKVKLITSAEEYGKNVTAQVVGVVNMDAYNARIDEENRLKEIAKQKAAIEKELKEEINKLQTFELYEKMANEHPENPRLAELVAELKGLSV